MKGLQPETLERYFGSKWKYPAGTLDIYSDLLTRGHGAQGIIGGMRANGVGHSCNVINYHGRIILVDPQIQAFLANPNAVAAVRLDMNTMQKMMAEQKLIAIGYLPIP